MFSLMMKTSNSSSLSYKLILLFFTFIAEGANAKDVAPEYGSLTSYSSVGNGYYFQRFFATHPFMETPPWKTSGISATRISEEDIEKYDYQLKPLNARWYASYAIGYTQVSGVDLFTLGQATTAGTKVVSDLSAIEHKAGVGIGWGASDWVDGVILIESELKPSQVFYLGRASVIGSYLFAFKETKEQPSERRKAAPIFRSPRSRVEDGIFLDKEELTNRPRAVEYTGQGILAELKGTFEHYWQGNHTNGLNGAGEYIGHGALKLSVTLLTDSVASIGIFGEKDYYTASLNSFSSNLLSIASADVTNHGHRYYFYSTVKDLPNYSLGLRLIFNGDLWNATTTGKYVVRQLASQGTAIDFSQDIAFRVSKRYWLTLAGSATMGSSGGLSSWLSNLGITWMF